MTARINLQLTKDENGFLLNGERSYDFQSGVEYVISSDSDIWVTWSDTNSHIQEATVTGSQILLQNLTCADHHRYVSDALMYYVQFKKFLDLDGIPIGLWDKEIDVAIDEEKLNLDVSNFISDVIIPSRKFMTNGSFEELFNLEQEDNLEQNISVVPVSDLTVRDFYFKSSDRYLAVLNGGTRIDPSHYKAFFVKNGDFNRIDLSEIPSGELLIKTDLCHNVRNNGSKEVTIIVREGDERKFFFNAYDFSYKTNFVGRGLASPENAVVIMNQFDDYALSKYPELYQFLKTYYNYENMVGTATSFERNMSDYFDIDKMPDDLLRKKIQTVFEPVDSVVVESRLFAKRLIDFFKAKGTPESFAWLANAMFQKPATIRRFSDEIIKLSSRETKKLLVIPIVSDDLLRLQTTGDVNKLGITYSSLDDIGSGLIGVMFQGRSSNSVGLVEDVEKKTYQLKDVYLLKCSVKSGEFEDGEFVDVKRLSGHVNLNQITIAQKMTGINSVSIVDGSSGYSVGEELEVKSYTGQGFRARVSRVDANGKIIGVQIDEAGWFYNSNADSVVIHNDDKIGSISFDPSQLNNSHVVDSGKLGYAVLDGDVVPVEVIGTSIWVNKTYEINRGAYMTRHPIAASRYRSDPVFFGKGFDNRTVYVVDQFDRAKKLNVEITTDIVSLLATDRTLYIVTNLDLITVSIEDIYSLTPKFKRFQPSSTSDFLRTYFIVGNKLYGLTANRVLQIDPDGSIPNSWAIGDAYDFSAYQKVSDVDTLYLGKGGTLSAYQWFSGQKKAVLEPVFGFNYELDLSEYDTRDVLSGSSKINDNDIYQDFSFGVVLNETTDGYMENFKKLVNPAGYKIKGIHLLEAASLSSDTQSIDVIINPFPMPPQGYNYLVNDDGAYLVNDDGAYLIASEG
jgi:hypothetical protein